MNTTHTVVERDRDNGLWIGIIVVLIVLGLIAAAFFSGAFPALRESNTTIIHERQDNTEIVPPTPTPSPDEPVAPPSEPAP